MRRRPAKRILPALLAALLAVPGCMTVGPDYEPPIAPLPAAYDAPIPALFRETPGVADWWVLFEDPVLHELIDRGRAENLQIAVAVSRVREARALAQAVAAQALPLVEAGGEAQVGRRFGDDDASDRGDTETLSLFVDEIWEIDLFGGLQRGRQAAFARVGQQAALAREAARIAMAEIARSYVEYRAAQRRLALAEQSLALQRRTLDLVDQRVSSGLAPGLDLVRARAAVASLRADVGPLRAQAARFRHALAILLAEPPGALRPLLEDERAIPVPQTGAAVGVPLDLLRRRPDIQAAELQIVAATADVGIAVADLYPRLSLPASVSLGLADLASGSIASSVLTSLSLLVDLPIYDGGERQANITAAEERVIQAGLQYRDTLLLALQEVESALLGYEASFTRREALRLAVENNRLAYEQSQELYRQGLAAFLDVLDAQREWNQSLQQLAEAERDLSLAVINLYAALGGTSPRG